ncbi:MAG: hypothetical protein M1814_001333 [Vezdaea aestivalis]|nr:MAG: hypothetical protein M1814_001333 [Vezdaea aestivalis]
MSSDRILRLSALARSHISSRAPSIVFSRRKLTTATSSTESTPINTTSAPAPIPTQVPKPKPQEVYYVQRTKSRNLPVYQEAKRGGNKLQTKIQKVEGDAQELRKQLVQALQTGDKDVMLNGLTLNIIVKVDSFPSRSCATTAGLTDAVTCIGMEDGRGQEILRE